MTTTSPPVGTDGPAVASPVAPDRDGPQTHLPRLPGLDGLRGLAVVAVLFFHGGFRWAKGGYLGVSVFFTLSGFLITNLLVTEWTKDGRISLRRFWARRFRRLMPASLLALVGIAAYGWFFGSPEQLQALRADLLAGLGYVANWRFVLEHKSYGDLFSAPSPVQHFWSLAIEEQFYVAYPLIAFGALRWGGRRRLALVLGALSIASLTSAVILRASTDRVYYGTDTRMFELLAGALFAVWWSARGHRADAPSTRPGTFALAVLGALALAGTVAMWPTVGETSRLLTRGVLPLQAALTVAMIVAASRPGVFARALAWRPFVAIGLVSYGLYLYHWPIFLILDEGRTHIHDQVALFAVRMVMTTAATLVSYYLLEQPIRRKRVLDGVRQVVPALVVSVAGVVTVSVLVTLNPPVSTLAYANVKLSDQNAVVHHSDSSATTVTSAGGTGGVAAPHTLMIIGDSGTYDAAPAIEAQFGAMGTVDDIDTSFPGFGLSRDPPGWRRTWPGLIDQYRPGLVVVMLGGWDVAYVKDKGRAAYEKLADEVIGVWTAHGAKVLWLGMLPGPGTDTSLMDSVFQEITAQHPGVVTYGTIDDSIVDAGSYPRWIHGDDGKLVLARKPDGWHLCPDGAARVGRAVAALASAAGLSSAPVTGWETDASWRSNPRYNDPVGGCDVTRAENAPPN